MSLSRMISQSQTCRNLLSQNGLNSFRGLNKVRYFKRLQEGSKTHVFETISPLNNASGNTANLRIENLWKPLGFTVAFSTACFGGAAIWQYENMRSHAVSMLKQPMEFFHKRNRETHRKFGSYRQQLNSWWNKLTPGEQVFVPICFINVLVFGAWRIPKMQPFMIKYFCSNPGSKSVCWPMLLSTFSHYSAFHLFANMYVLHSFSTGAVATLGKEQFLGLYLSAGVISSFTSYIYKTLTKQPGLSLGASGAIMAILGYVCTQYPDTKLGIIFLPFLTFSAGSAIKAIVGLDIIGVIMGWKIFDHAAHIGGAACGIAWAYWGNKHLWLNREPILQYWHDLRGSIK